MHQAAGGPLTQSDEALAFLAGYGWAMWAVQHFEYYLAALSILRTPVKSPARRIATAQKAYSALQRQFATYRHLFERASASELLKLLPADLPEQLRTNVEDLIPERNDLAHRYLRRVLEQSTAPDLGEELRSVRALGQRFADAGDELRLLAEQSVAARPPNLSDAQFEALQRLGRAAASGESLDDALSHVAGDDEPQRGA
jgi:hypothetical protein